MKERVDFLIDRYFDFREDRMTFRIEQPIEGCICLDYGLVSKEWLYKRPSACDCPVQSDDYETFLHAVDCDSVPCPFCHWESP